MFLWQKIMGNLFVKEEAQHAEKIRRFNNQVAKSLHVDEILADTVDIIQETEVVN